MVAAVLDRPSPPVLPSLESGDELTQEEFHRIYLCRPDIRKAELVEGVVYVDAASVNAGLHGEPHLGLSTWLGTYRISTLGVRASDNSTLILDARNEFQPDLMMWYDKGRLSLDEQGWAHGAPELAIEVSSSSATIDLNKKLQVYQRNGVREYLVWVVPEKRVVWFALREGVFVPMQPDAKGVLHSEVFPGLNLDVAKLIAGDWSGVLAGLNAP